MNTDPVRPYRAMVTWGIILSGGAAIVSWALPRLGTWFTNIDPDLLRSSQTVGIGVTLVLSIVGATLTAVGAILFLRARRVRNIPLSGGTQTGTGVASLETELQKLADMRSRNIIDDAEYRRLRENLINRR